MVPAAVPPPFSSSLTAVTAVAKQSTAGVQPDEGSDESSGETVGEAVAASSGVGRSMPKKQLTVQVQFGSEDGGQGLDGHQGRGSSLAWGDEDEGESAPERELRLAGKGDGVENADWFVPLRTRCVVGGRWAQRGSEGRLRLVVNPGGFCFLAAELGLTAKKKPLALEGQTRSRLLLLLPSMQWAVFCSP